MNKPKTSFFIHPTAEIHPSVIIGNGTKIWNLVQVRENACIGEGCTISKDVYIDVGVKIGDRIKIQNGVSIYQGVTLEDDTFIGPHAAFTNDIMPRSFNAEWEIVPTLVRRGASIGANATIICGVTLGPYSMISAGSTLTSDAPPHGLMSGSPARLVAFLCRRGHRMISMSAKGYADLFVCIQCNESLSVDYCYNNTRDSLLEKVSL
jgi:UDP-2-acetamido-3-amino-2,3-dideoxy-glucuronate N-acetyltransferase